MSREEYEAEIGVRDAEIRRLSAATDSRHTARADRSTVSRSMMSFERTSDDVRRLQEVLEDCVTLCLRVPGRDAPCGNFCFFLRA